jgi:hypothetical protein
MSSTNELSDIDEFAEGLKSSSLGSLVDQLILVRLNELRNEADESVTEKSKRALRLQALRQEISRRQVSQEDVETAALTGGVTTLGGMFE